MGSIIRSAKNLALLAALLPPLAGPPALTSGFGEYRSGGRFHAGLDYSTGGRTGRPVRATDDGWVERVRTSGVGYGRSVYLHLADGRTAVYGHLDHFAPALEAYVAARQDSTGTYEQDLWPGRGVLPFRRGDVLAWSGQTGAGPPHLHFEIRRGDMNLHPLRQGIAVADATPPTIAALTVTPLGPRARVGGDVDPWRGSWPKGGDLRVPDVVGPFRLALDTWDRVGARANRLATYRLVARVDGRVAYEAVLDSVSWGDMAIADRIFDLAATQAGATNRRRLDSIPRDATGIVRAGRAAFDLPVGPHELEFVAVDEAGNETRRSARVTVRSAAAPGPAPRSGVLAAATAGRPAIVPRDGAVFVAARAGDPRPPFADWPELALVDSFAVAGGTLWTLDPPSSPSRRPGASGVFLAGRGAGSIELDPGVTLAWEADTFYEPAALRVTTAPTGEPGGELIAVSARAVALEPEDLALAKSVRLAWTGAAAGPGGAPVGLFRGGGRSWSLLTGAGAGGAFEGTTRRLGAFALLADATPPRIVPPTAYAARTGVVPAPFVARITDRGAGLVAAEQRLLLDGRPVPAEYDPESDRLTWRPRAALPAGAHEFVVEAVDALGNRSSVRVPVEVR